MCSSVEIIKDDSNGLGSNLASKHKSFGSVEKLQLLELKSFLGDLDQLKGKNVKLFRDENYLIMSRLGDLIGDRVLGFKQYYKLSIYFLID